MYKRGGVIDNCTQVIQFYARAMISASFYHGDLGKVLEWAVREVRLAASMKRAATPGKTLGKGH